MKLHDRIIEELASSPGLTSRNLADRLGKSEATLHTPLKRMVDAGYVTSSDSRPAVHSITDAGKKYLKSDEFGIDDAAPPAQEAGDVSVGVFTSGEVHISANGKTVKLSKDQAKQVVDFICSLPSRLFNDEQRPTMASLPSRVFKAD